MRLLLVAAILAAIAAPVMASEPGEPLDCTDWVFLAEGLSCSPVIQYPCTSEFCRQLDDSDRLGNHRVTDNLGNTYLVRSRLVVEEHNSCSPLLCEIESCNRVELVQMDSSGQETVIGFIEDRCDPEISGIDQRIDHMALENRRGSSVGHLVFLPTVGRIQFVLHNRCFRTNPPGAECYESGFWLAGIDGFATTFEVLQSYTPAANGLGFTVPFMPEGFQYADFFDSYHGDLSTVGEWSKAKPLQCGYPATPPSVGDFFAVEDTLPNPEPGTGRYYVTATHFMGDTRYGRKANGGILTGRDPAVLPECE